MKQSQLFFNRCFDKNKLKYLISWSLKTHGEAKTLALVEKLKDVGFFWATQAGISLSLDDLRIPNEKSTLLQGAEKDVQTSLTSFSMGNLTAVERLQQLIDAWHKTSENLKNEVVQNFRTSDPLNPVYMMAFSGARGNLSQVRQLVGMRGLMADPQGRIIDFPIRSNFREGLTLTEYVISCYGARKGVVDTALRTATSGYLTRRLVDVAQHVVVSTYDCETTDGVLTSALTQSSKVILSLYDRLLGRVLAEDIPGIAFRNQPISEFLAYKISQSRAQVLVRSSLTCKARNGVCQLCYGWSLGHNDLVSIGEAVGIIAAQSIGEPGTQLTMRTFHTGGVFSGEIIDQVESPCTGIVTFQDKFPGTLVRTSYGKIGFLTRKAGSLFINSVDAQTGHSKIQKVDFPNQSILFVRQGQKINSKELLFEYASTATDQDQGIQSTHLVTSPKEGEIFFEDVVILQEGEEAENRADQLGSFWILSGTVMNSTFEDLGSLKIQSGDLFYKKSPLTNVNIVPFRQNSNVNQNLPIFLTNQTANLPILSANFASLNAGLINYFDGSYITALKFNKQETTNFPQNASSLINEFQQPLLSLVNVGLKGTSSNLVEFSNSPHNSIIVFSNPQPLLKYFTIPRKINTRQLSRKRNQSIVSSFLYNVSLGSKHDGFSLTKKLSKQYLRKGTYNFNDKPKNFVSISKYYSEKVLNFEKPVVKVNQKPWIYFVNLRSNSKAVFKDFVLNSLILNSPNQMNFKFGNYLGSFAKLNQRILKIRSFKETEFPVRQVTKKYAYSNFSLAPKIIFLLNKTLFSQQSSVLNILKFKNSDLFTRISVNSQFLVFKRSTLENFSGFILNKQSSDSELQPVTPISFSLKNLTLNKQNSLNSVFILSASTKTNFSNLEWKVFANSYWNPNFLNLMGQSKVILPNLNLKFLQSSINAPIRFSKNGTQFGKLSKIQKLTGELVRIKKSQTNLPSGALMLTKNDLLGISTNTKNSELVVGSLIRPGDEITKNLTIHNPTQVISVKRNRMLLRKATPILFSSKATFHVFHKDFIQQGLPLITLSYRRLTTGDIVQGIPRIEQLFEARQTTTLLHDQLHELFENYKTRMPLEVAARKSLYKIQRILIDSIQRVYQTQGVMISDKHLEIIVKQMTSTVKILDGGRTRLLRGELKSIEWIERINSGIDIQKAEYEPILLGITKASLETESFISAASFQETTRTLSRAALEGRTDFLRGLKENVILGHRIPAGTGAPLISYLTKFQTSLDNDVQSPLNSFSGDNRLFSTSNKL